ncbi:MAG: carboxypeptidase-like regulatory domain-containing protein [Salinivirgaceae bacterium]|nr:carboxypeptidase-like regulatory domain-containing protein [Salinivirgaceae bacterium]
MKTNKYLVYGRIIAFVFLAISAKTSFSQIKISGYVIDKKTNESLIGAHVCDNVNKNGTITNGYGFFSLTLPNNSRQLKLNVSYIGYFNNERNYNFISDTTITIKLETNNVIKEVTVAASKELPIEQRNEISIISIPKRDLQMLPNLGGERDIIKAYQLMPGVQSGTEGSSGLYVRGGSPDQNLILLDDVPIYYVNHLGGFTSIFNDDAINTTKLIKGGFPAQYGSRLSSVLDVKMKDGNSKDFSSAFSIGLLTSKVLFEGPIEKDTSSYLISVRRFMYDLLTRPISRLATGNSSVGYTFWDVNVKLNRIMSAKDRLFFSAYFGDDKVGFKTNDKESADKYQAKYTEKWGNIMIATKWNHLYNHRLFGNTIASFTRYRYVNTLESESNTDGLATKGNTEFFSGISDVSFKPTWEYFISNNTSINFGVNSTYHFFKPGNVINYSEQQGEAIIDQKQIKNLGALETAVYFENQFKLNVGLSLNLGLRYANYFVEGSQFHSLEPRISAGYLFYKIRINASYAKMQQNIHLLTNSGLGIPVQFWVPAIKKAQPSASHQFTFGIATTIFNNYEFSAESYYKTMDDLICFKEGASYFGTESYWDDKIETNELGKSYGIELLLQRKIGKVTGWISYTWSKNTRQFNNINNGEIYPFKYDRTHDISLVLNYKLSKRVDFSATWVYGTEQAMTFATSKYYMPNISLDELNLQNIYNNGDAQEIELYSKKNSFRAEPYHRLDIGFNFRKEKPRGTRTWNISIYNLYNRKNPHYYYFSNNTTNGKGEVKIMKKSLFPILPSISYSFQFK